MGRGLPWLPGPAGTLSSPRVCVLPAFAVVLLLLLLRFLLLLAGCCFVAGVVALAGASAMALPAGSPFVWCNDWWVDFVWLVLDAC